MPDIKFRIAQITAGTVGIFFVFFILIGCSSGQKDGKGEAEEVVVEEVVVEEDVWVIDEHQINDIAITSAATSDAEITAEADEAEAEVDTQIAEEEAYEEAAYEILEMAVIEAALAEQEYEATQVVEVTEVAVPLDETQTVVSYNKKGKAEAAFQVISTPGDNEIEQIIFTDKKHKDVYDVQAGLTGKQVKRLRKEMKHMVKKGKVFMYSDESIIMYLMTTTNMLGDEVTTADVETMEVQAVIWKDKKHHKKK